jgi:hypothetical protein
MVSTAWKINKLLSLVFGCIVCAWLLALAGCAAPTDQPTATPPPSATPTSVPTPTTVPTATTGSQGTEAAGGIDLDAFQSSLMQAIVERNGQIMVQAMGDPFTIAGWQAEGAEWEPDDAVDQLFTRYMAAGATITFGEPQPNLTKLLGGTDPLTMWGPNVKAISALYSAGWGPEGKDEAILIVAQGPDGSLYWHSLLYASGGFVQSAPAAPDSFREVLVNALTASPRDYAYLQTFMGDSFSISGWRAQGSDWPPAEAVEQLRTIWQPASSSTSYNLSANISAILDNADPYAMFPGSVSFIYSQGWGPEAKDEAVLIISQRADGTYYWSGVLIAKNGFSPGGEEYTGPGFTTTDLATFQATLIDALYAVPRDYAWLQTFMDSQFFLSLTTGPGGPMPAAEAVEGLRTDWLPLSAEFSYQSNVDAASVYGQDPKAGFPNVVADFFSTGWGPEGEGKAIVLIGQREDGTCYWFGIIYAEAGF